MYQAGLIWNESSRTITGTPLIASEGEIIVNIKAERCDDKTDSFRYLFFEPQLGSDFQAAYAWSDLSTDGINIDKDKLGKIHLVRGRPCTIIGVPMTKNKSYVIRLEGEPGSDVDLMIYSPGRLGYRWDMGK